MKILILIIGGAYLLYLVFGIYHRFQIGHRLVEAAEPFVMDTSDTTTTVLVLGDSTGVGVGAAVNKSVAALFAKEIGATFVENYSVSGAKVADIENQIERIQRDHYDVILLQVGGNDILGFTSIHTSTRQLRSSIELLRSKTDTLIHLSAGNVGAAAAVPFFLKPLYHARTRAYHAAFQGIADELHTLYVNLYITPRNDPFIKEPKKYLSNDGLHPSNAGYALWFEKVRVAYRGKKSI